MFLVADRADEEVNFEYYLVGGQIEVTVSSEDGAITAHEVFVGTAPIDMPVLNTNADQMGQLIIGSDAAVPAGQDIALSFVSRADCFTDEKSDAISLTRPDHTSGPIFRKWPLRRLAALPIAPP